MSEATLGVCRTLCGNIAASCCYCGLSENLCSAQRVVLTEYLENWALHFIILALHFIKHIGSSVPSWICWDVLLTATSSTL